ncbi:MAG: folate family ECF transporter S component [Oscillospiraceae bacterium]|nr:folate family ECF transporter S component [Oscillospiraceae bacterium]
MKKRTTFGEDIRVLGRVKVLTICAMLVAMGVVIGILCKNFLTFGIYYRFTLENLPVFFAAIAFGPFAGAAVGICEDVVSCLCSTNPAVNPIITVGAAAVGFFSGLISHHFSFKSDNRRIAVSIIAGHLIGQVAIKSIAKIVMFGMPWWGVFIGLGFSAVAGTIEFIVLRMLFKNSAIQQGLKGIYKK